jgi:hypothetical protein
LRKKPSEKGRNRDTAWYSIVDSEWPGIRAAFERWLDPANFDPDGRQRERLSTLIGARRTRLHADSSALRGQERGLGRLACGDKKSNGGASLEGKIGPRHLELIPNAIPRKTQETRRLRARARVGGD